MSKIGCQAEQTLNDFGTEHSRPFFTVKSYKYVVATDDVLVTVVCEVVLIAVDVVVVFMDIVLLLL